jgi:hypothetical protein
MSSTDYVEFFAQARNLAEGHDDWDVYTDIVQTCYADPEMGASGHLTIIITKTAETRHGDDVEVAHVSEKSPDLALAMAAKAIASFLATPPKSEPCKCVTCGQVIA